MVRHPAALAFVALVGCSSSMGSGSGEPPPGTPVSAAPVAIAKIVTRDRSITLYSGHGSVRATVLDASGKLVAREVDIDDLQTIDASAYDACHSSFAAQTTVGARLDGPDTSSATGRPLGF